MRKGIIALLCVFVIIPGTLFAAELDFRGSGTVYANGIENYRFGGQFLPILEGSFLSQESPYILDAELSANTYAYYDSSRSITSDLSPYRCWLRFAGSQFEVRTGLQKITFGQAQMLRPLMWYDSIDPRDPLSLTKGKWAVRARYYFPDSNNNLWLWGIWETAENTDLPIEGYLTGDEAVYSGGARFQVEMAGAEFGLSGSFADYENTNGVDPQASQFTDELRDYRMGLDMKWDWEIGMWLEASALFRNSVTLQDVMIYTPDVDYSIGTRLLMATLGADYTLPVGNGIYVMAEVMLTDLKIDKLIVQDGETPYYQDQVFFTGFMAQYPLGIFDSIGLMSFILPQNDFKHYSFLFWQRQYDMITLRLSGALTNLDAGEFSLFGTEASASLGNMIQFMLVYDFKWNMIQ